MEQLNVSQTEATDAAESSNAKIEGQKEAQKTAEPIKCDEELDVKSEKFNPLKALYAPAYRVTEKHPKIIYQNMAAFETALKKVGILGLNSKPTTTQASGSKDAKSKNTLLVEEDKIRRRFQEHQLAIKTQRKEKNKHQRNIFTQMSQFQGPLKKLQDYVAEGRGVKVIIRKEHGIKGYVEGRLKMFDRHWNILLTDVEECYETRKYKYAENKLVTHQEPQDCSDILFKLGIKLPEQCIKSLGRKKVEIKRHLPQLLVRGEHVVLVTAKIEPTAKCNT